jgi:hypothetical protein
MSGKRSVASFFSTLLPFAMSADEKRSQNLSTCRATPTEEAKLKKFIKLKGFRRPSDFWHRCMETFIEQTEAGQDLAWPLHFAQRIPNSAQAKKLPPKKKGTAKV